MVRSATTRDRRLIGIPIGVRTTVEAEAMLREVAYHADVAELRLDLMDEYDLPRLLANRPCPVVVTNRPKRAGGRFRGGEEARVWPLLEAIDLGAEYVDVEDDAVHLIPDRQRTRLVVSYHDFQGMPGDFVGLCRQLAAKGVDVVKVAGMARRLQDNLPVLDALAQASQPTIAIAMGEAGLLSRVVALRYDSCFLTYATLGKRDLTAPGQIPIAAMRRVYQAEKIGPRTVVYGVLSAAPVSERLLTRLNAATRESGLDGVWVPFVATGREGEGPAEVVRAYERLGVAGYVVAESARASVLAGLDDVVLQGPGGGVDVVYPSGGRLAGVWEPDLSRAFALITGHAPAASLQAAGRGRVAASY